MIRHMSMRTLSVLLGAVALFAAVGFAASFAINLGPTVNAEGETLVISCSDLVKVDKIDEWRDPADGGLPGDGGFYVKTVRVIIPAGSECIGNYYYVVLTGDAGQALAMAPTGALPHPQLGSGANAVDFAPFDIRVADLHDIHVLISSTPQPFH